MRIAIIGFGREGKAVFDYLRKSPRYRRAAITVLDKNGGLALPKGVFAKCGEHYLADLNDFNLVFRSPGVPYLTPEIQRAKERGVQISSATKLFFEDAKGTVVGVTGTKGKGTVSTLLYTILKAGKRDAYLAGNIGTPALRMLPKLAKNSITVFELSSFQLQDLSLSPRIAVVLDIFPDHMDSHGSFDEYVDAKANIAKHQTSRDAIFYSATNAYSRDIAMQSRGKKHAVRAEGFRLFTPADLQIPGEHNFRNAVMAATVALSLGVTENIIVKTVKRFRGLPHRLEFVREMEIAPRTHANPAKTSRKPFPHKSAPGQQQSASVKFYNDSGGTNPNTAAAAVRSFKEPLILIAGGKDKNLDYAPLAHAARESQNLKAIILIGENKAKIHDALRNTENHGLRITECETLANAVHAAHKTAIHIAQSANQPSSSVIGHRSSVITILFSPGAASFDLFKDYADRGNQFKKIVKEIKMPRR